MALLSPGHLIATAIASAAVAQQLATLGDLDAFGSLF